MGQIEVVCGPMFSGKTEELIRRLRRAMFGRQSVIVFKPRIDTRYADADIVSHTEQRFNLGPGGANLEPDRRIPQKAGATPTGDWGRRSLPVLRPAINPPYQTLGQQRHTHRCGGTRPGLPWKAVYHHARVVGVADYVTKQQAVCVVCAQQRPRVSGYTPRAPVNPEQTNFTGETKDQILVGAGDAYEARCRRCHVKTVDIPHFLEPPRVV